VLRLAILFLVIAVVAAFLGYLGGGPRSNSVVEEELVRS
jgi:uncharacterized membrane protein YtjA (UPF0391 family)